MELDEDQIRAECMAIKEKGITDVAIVGIFSPLDTKGVQEERVKKIVLEEMPEADVVCSRDSETPTLNIWCTGALLIPVSWSTWFPRTRKCHDSQHVYSQVRTNNHTRIQIRDAFTRAVLSSLPDSKRWDSHRC